jgi:hypothetical protein
MSQDTCQRCLRTSQWRWRWDLNPRLSFPNTRFRGVLLWPLGHATKPEDTVTNFLFVAIGKMIGAVGRTQWPERPK